jgi:hypothetical protein
MEAEKDAILDKTLLLISFFEPFWMLYLQSSKKLLKRRKISQQIEFGY